MLGRLNTICKAPSMMSSVNKGSNTHSLLIQDYTPIQQKATLKLAPAAPSCPVQSSRRELVSALKKEKMKMTGFKGNI